MNNKEQQIPAIRFKGFTDAWEQRKLEDLAESFNYGLNASAMEFDGENKYIRITDIDEYSHRFIESGLTSPNTDLSNADDYLLKEGDILFARTGASVGKSYQYEPLDGKVYYAGFLIRARIKPEFHSSFIFQNTLTEKYNNFIKITSQRSGQPGVNAQEYANFSIMVPSRGEQVKLGNFFKQLDNAIDLHQRQLNKYNKLKKTLLQKMFPKSGAKSSEIRFDGFTEEWKQCKLDQIVIERNQQVQESIDFPLMSFTAKDGVTPKSDRYNREFLVKSDNKKYKKTELGDLIYSSNNLDVGSIGINKTGNAVISSVYSIFYTRDGITPEFVDMLIQRKDFINKMIQFRQGVVYGQWRIHESDFLKIETRIPSSKEQIKMGALFKQIDNTIAFHQQKVNGYQQLKEALLKKMFI